MNSDNFSIVNKKSDLIWIVTFVPLFLLLLIVNLQYLVFLYSRYTDRLFFAFYNSFIGTIPHLSALLNFNLVSATFSFGKRSNINWRVIFLLLFVCNLVFFGHMLSYISNPFFLLALFGAFPYFLILSVVDYIAFLIKKQPFSRIIWIISYAALISVSVLLFLSGVFVFQFSAFGLIHGI